MCFPDDDLSGLTSRKRRKSSINESEEESFESSVSIDVLAEKDFSPKAEHLGNSRRRKSSANIAGTLLLTRIRAR